MEKKDLTVQDGELDVDDRTGQVWNFSDYMNDGMFETSPEDYNMNLFIRSQEEMKQCFTSPEFCKFLIQFPKDMYGYKIGHTGGMSGENIYQLPKEWHPLCSVTAFYHKDLLQLKTFLKEKNVTEIKNDIMDIANGN